MTFSKPVDQFKTAQQIRKPTQRLTTLHPAPLHGHLKPALHAETFDELQLPILERVHPPTRYSESREEFIRGSMDLLQLSRTLERIGAPETAKFTCYPDAKDARTITFRRGNGHVDGRENFTLADLSETLKTAEVLHLLRGLIAVERLEYLRQPEGNEYRLHVPGGVNVEKMKDVGMRADAIRKEDSGSPGMALYRIPEAEIRRFFGLGRSQDRQ